MIQLYAPLAQKDPHNVKPVLVAGPVEPGNPDPGRPAKLTLLPPVHSAERSAVPSGASGLYFYKYDSSDGGISGSGCDQVDIPVTVSESAMQNLPAATNQPSFGDTFAPHAQIVRLKRHGGTIEAGVPERESLPRICNLSSAADIQLVQMSWV